MDIGDVETIEIEVEPKPSNIASKVETSEFAQELYKLLAEGSIWRTSKVLANKLGVDAIELDKFLSQQSVVVRKAAKEEGVFLYALVKRLEIKKEEKEVTSRPIITEEDRYAIANLNCCLTILTLTLEKYALKISEKDMEVFSNLVQAKDKLHAGIVLFAAKMDVNMKKMI